MAERVVLNGLEAQVAVPTELVLARTSLSSRAIVEARRAGRMEFKGEADGRVFLEVGGVVIGEGRIVKKAGRNYFKVLRLSAAEAKEDTQ